MNGNKIYGNRSIRPTYDKVQKNASTIHSSVGSISTGFTSNESINDKRVMVSKEINNSKNMSEFERNSMLLALNTVGLNQVSFFGMDQNQFNNYYQNFSRNRKNINSHDLAYKVLSSIQQKYPIKREENKQDKKTNQQTNFKNNLRSNIVQKKTEKNIVNNSEGNKVIKNNNTNKQSITNENTEFYEKEQETQIQTKSRRSIVNQVIKEDIIKPDKNVIINGNEIIFPENINNKKRNNIVNQKEQGYSLQTVNIDVNDKVSNINGKSCVLLDEFVLDKMK